MPDVEAHGRRVAALLPQTRGRHVRHELLDFFAALQQAVRDRLQMRRDAVDRTAQPDFGLGHVDQLIAQIDYDASMKIAAIVLIVIGVIALAYGGISYTREEKVLDIGPIEATAKKRETIPLPPILGVAAIAGGVVMLVAAGRKR